MVFGKAAVFDFLDTSQNFTYDALCDFAVCPTNDTHTENTSSGLQAEKSAIRPLMFHLIDGHGSLPFNQSFGQAPPHTGSSGQLTHGRDRSYASFVRHFPMFTSDHEGPSARFDCSASGTSVQKYSSPFGATTAGCSATATQVLCFGVGRIAIFCPTRDSLLNTRSSV